MIVRDMILLDSPPSIQTPAQYADRITMPVNAVPQKAYFLELKESLHTKGAKINAVVTVAIEPTRSAVSATETEFILLIAEVSNPTFL